MHVHKIFDIITAIVAICSVTHTILPPWEALNDFPTAQKYYKVFVYSVGYIALNGRSTLYNSISTKEGTTPSKATIATGDAECEPDQQNSPMSGGK